jgi:hypothetical protein
MSEEDFDVGRKIGLVARRNRELYETVKQIAKRKGMKMQDVLTEALDIWRLYQTLEEVEPKALVAALSFIEHMLNYSASLLVKLGSVFTSEFFRSTMAMAGELSQLQQTQQAQQQTQQQSPVSEVKEQLRLMILQSMMPMLMSIIQQIIASMSGGQSVQIPSLQAPALTTRSTRPIKIEA